MNISIFKKYILFSSKPGTHFLLPNTSFKVTLYPTRVLLKDLESEKSIDFQFDTQGPVENFEAKLDLEKNRVELSGKSPLAFFRFYLFEKDNSIELLLKKGPKNGFTNIKLNESLMLIRGVKTAQKPFEKLSFGSHKALDLSKIEERKDLKELIPILYSLSQKMESKASSHRQGTAKLLDFPEEKVALEKQFLSLYTFGFSGIIPTLTDHFQGYLSSNEKISDQASPLILLKELGVKIRSLFFKEDKNTFYLLQTLLNSFPAGRMVNIQTNYGTFDLQWSEKRLRKVIFHSKVNDQIALVPQRQIHSFRLKTSRRDKGIILKSKELFTVKENQTIFLDKFEK